MNIQKNFLAFTLSVFSVISFADTNSCAAFLTLGAYNLAQSGNDTDTDLFKKASFCSSEYNPKSAQAALIESAYGLLGGSDLAGINDAQKRLCNGFGSDIYIGKTSQAMQNLFQDSIQQWNNCQNLAQKGVDFIMQPTRNLQSFSFTLSTTLGNQEKFLGLAQGGFGRSICKATFSSREGSGLKLKTIATDETTALSFDFNNKLQIICNRQMQKDSNGDFSAEAQTLQLKTGKGTYQVEVDEIGALSKKSVEQIKAEIQNDSVHIESGIYEGDSKILQVLQAPTKHSCQPFIFDRPFKNSPKVIFGFSTINDYNPTAGLRAYSHTESITTTGFTMCIDTFADSGLSDSVVNWLAYGK